MSRTLRPLCLLSALLLSTSSLAQTGVSDDRVSLPEGPGSLEGVGENVEIDPNMGLMSYSVPFKLPAGFPGMTPDLGLSYSSGAGGSMVGMGWSMRLPMIERMTARGLPEYDRDDEFAVNGGDQLVQIPGTDPPVYRSRFEKGFIRYTWMDAGDGTEGYWRAEHPDGRVSYYGADATGALVDQARVAGITGTFRYHLVETVDPYGHALRYTYDLFGNVTLPLHVGWVYDGDQPTYEVSFVYADRNDLLSDCKPGFNELLTKRLSQVNVLAHGTRVRHYLLRYEDESTSGGFSRLVAVQLYGVDGSPYPSHESFAYSRGLGAACQQGDGCQRPYMTEMGSIGVNLMSGDTTLIDINGDALPDIIDTSQAGAPHRFFINRLQPDGAHAFEGAMPSAIGNQGGHDLSSPYVRVMDIDGDGRTDMVNSSTGQVLRNMGGGDWDEAYSLWAAGGGGLPDLDQMAAVMRFVDYDNDKKIDVITSQGTSDTMVYRNMGDAGFLAENVDPIGAGFDDQKIELNDVNGDGLLDVVQVMTDNVRYRLNLGWGRWDTWVVMGGDSATFQSQADAERAELEDINGDALADLVFVIGSEVQYWINRNGDSFEPMQAVTSADIDGDIPVRTSETVVLYADMNGNGSSDVVWIDQNGAVSYLELFPARPNLMSRVENGLGKVSELIYGSSALHMARDGGPGAWPHPLPHAMLVVDTFDTWNELTGVHETTDYVYHDGFYDGLEKQFRGFARVEQVEPGDATSEEGLALETYDVGDSDPYFNGLLLTREILGAGGRSLQYQESEYADCPVAGVPASGLLFDVRHVCQVRELTELREGLQASEWVRTEKRVGYDGYGNQILNVEEGVTSIGGGACPACEGDLMGAPCGAQCLGDEQYARSEYADPAGNGDRWFLRKEIRKRSFGKADASDEPATEQYTETLNYYDGEDFVGLPHGQVTHGGVVRVTERLNSAGDLVETTRNRLDAHGNLIEVLDALGAVGGDTHRRLFTMDPSGLRVVRTEILVSDDQGPYRLQREYSYHPQLDLISEASNWQLMRGGSAQNPRYSSFWAYDEWTRRISMTRPGEQAGQATEEYTWALGNPVSRATIRSRSQAGGPVDFEKVTCFDGHGRIYQQRTKLAPGSYKVDGFTVFNLKGEKREVFQPYAATSGNCDLAPPAGTLSVRSEFDALGRVRRQVLPATSADGGQEAALRTEYLPLTEVKHDVSDSATSSPHAGTPKTKRFNGLGKLVAEEELLEAGGQPLVHRYGFDEQGNLAAVTDPGGNTRAQTHDLFGRVTQVDDPDRGLISFEHDAEGNLVRRVDAEGQVWRFSYDGSNRTLAEWDEADESGTKISYRYDDPGDCPTHQCSNVAGHLVSTRYPLDDGSFGEDRAGFDQRAQATYRSRELDGHLFEFRTQYDNLGRPQTDLFPTGYQLSYEYDGAGRLLRVPGYIEALVYDARGELEELSLANGVITTSSFDQRRRVSAISATGPGNSTVLDYAYSRDLEGNIIEVVDGRDDDGEPMGSARYTYDALYRLTEAHLDPDRPTHVETLSYDYDVIGNLTSKSSSLDTASPAHVGALTYGGAGAGPHAVTRAGDIDLSYDAAGRLLQRGGDAYSWDFQGRMASAHNASGEQARFVYGSSSERVIKRAAGSVSYFVSSSFEVRDGVAVTYLIVDSNRVAKIEEPGFAATLLSDVAPASGADDAIAPEPDDAITAGDAWIAQAVGAGVLSLASPAELSAVEALLEASLRRMMVGMADKVSFMHHDHLGGTVVVTDDSGQVSERYEYYPYGMERYALGGGQDYGFVGKEQDRITGLLYFGARYYDPWTGRWTAPDPHFNLVDEEGLASAGEATGAYEFDRNNPINFVDKDGNSAKTVIGAIAAAAFSPGGFVIGAVVGAIKSQSDAKGLSGPEKKKFVLRSAIAGGTDGGAIAGGVAAVAVAAPAVGVLAASGGLAVAGLFLGPLIGAVSIVALVKAAIEAPARIAAEKEAAAKAAAKERGDSSTETDSSSSKSGVENAPDSSSKSTVSSSTETKGPARISKKSSRARPKSVRASASKKKGPRKKSSSGRGGAKKGGGGGSKGSSAKSTESSGG